MSDSIFSIVFEVYLVVGTAYLFLSSRDRQIARLRAVRPNWREDQRRQFVIVFRILFALATILFPVYIFKVYGLPQ